MNFRNFLALEAALSRRLIRDWRESSQDLLRGIEKAVAEGQYGKAAELAKHIDLSEVGDKNRDYIEYMLRSFAVFGAKMANRRVLRSVNLHDQPIANATIQFLQSLEWGATVAIQDQVLQSIAVAEQQEKGRQLAATQKADLTLGDLGTAGRVQASTVGIRYRKKKVRKIGVHTLYVSRKLRNAETFIHWAKQQGFTTTLLPDDLHVTVIFSKKPVEWGDLPHESWVETVIASGGKRRVEPLGDKGAVVLHFECQQLRDRWQEGRDIGCSWDYEGYQPHITISYTTPPGLDLGKVVPFTGALEFGPEIYEPVDSDKVKVEKADDGRVLTDFVTFGEAGDRMLMMTSSLMSSRISTYGFVAEAEHTNQPRYALSAILDGRTSPFCRMIDGREFDLQSAKSLIGDVLSVQNPEDLKTIQEWPDQSEEAIAEYEAMSEEELVEAGLNIPPFHPWCRTMCVSVEGTGEQAPALEAPDVEDPDVEREQASAADFEAIGQSLTEEQLQEWNAYIDTLPNKMLASMLGLTEKEVLEAQLKAGAISMAKDGTWDFNGQVQVGSVRANVGSILDPYLGKVYLDELTFLAGGKADATAFMGTLLSNMVSQGTSIGATSLVVQTGGNAFQYAQMGFLPSPDDWQFMRFKIMDDLDGGKLATTYARLNDDEKALVLNLLSNEHEGALGVLADLPILVNGKAIGEILLDGIQAEFTLDLLNPLALSRAQQYL